MYAFNAYFSMIATLKIENKITRSQLCECDELLPSEEAEGMLRYCPSLHDLERPGH